jgi:hypothetical protein
MSQAAQLNLGIQRNEDYIPHVYVLENSDDTRVDLTGWTFNLRVNSAEGLTGDPALSITSVPNANGSYIVLTSGPRGEFELFISKADMAAFSGPVDDDTVFVHNLLGTDNEGHQRIIARGIFTVEPGV